MRALALSLALSSSPVLALPTTGARSIFLNGIDISSARSQDLKHVDIHISDNGDLFVIAPHYQVNEEDTYVPLSKYVQGLNQPAHKPPQAIEAGQMRELPSDAPAGGQLMPKAGEVPPPAASTAQTVLPPASVPTTAAAKPGDPAAKPASGDEPPPAAATPPAAAAPAEAPPGATAAATPVKGTPPAL